MLTASVNIMTLRLTKQSPAAAVLAYASDRGVGPSTIAEATGLSQHEIVARLYGDADLTVSELVQIGGLLSVSPTDLIKED